MRILTRKQGRIYTWLPVSQVWLDLESADLDTALRDFYFIGHGASKLGDRPEPIAFVPLPQGPWKAVGYDQVTNPHPGFEAFLRGRGYRVAHRSKPIDLPHRDKSEAKG